MLGIPGNEGHTQFQCSSRNPEVMVADSSALLAQVSGKLRCSPGNRDIRHNQWEARQEPPASVLALRAVAFPNEHRSSSPPKEHCCIMPRCLVRSERMQFLAPFSLGIRITAGSMQ